MACNCASRGTKETAPKIQPVVQHLVRNIARKHAVHAHLHAGMHFAELGERGQQRMNRAFVDAEGKFAALQALELRSSPF